MKKQLGCRGEAPDHDILKKSELDDPMQLKWFRIPVDGCYEMEQELNAFRRGYLVHHSDSCSH